MSSLFVSSFTFPRPLHQQQRLTKEACDSPHRQIPINTNRNPIHKAHAHLIEMSLTAPNVGKNTYTLVHATCGPTQEDDIPGAVRYHTYEELQKVWKNDKILWAYLPYSMHMAGPREAIMHAMMRKNYGCSAFVVGRDMAGSKSSITGEDFYGMFDAQDLLIKHSEELGIKAVPSADIVYCEEVHEYRTVDDAKKNNFTVKKLSGTKFRKMLRGGEDIPEWFAFPEVVKVLRQHV